ncbi:MAG: TadE/TadG family type IV pilus assembly protein [Hyphomonas sp.]
MARRYKYGPDTSGATAPIFAVSLMAIVGLVGATLALAMDGRAASNLQSTADSAALAGATAFVATESPRVADRLGAAQDSAVAIANGNSDFYITDLSIAPFTEDAYGQHTEIDVTMAFSPANPAANLAGRNASIEIERTAVATATWGFPLCILSLSETGTGLSTSGSANLHADGCIVWANSKSHTSMDFGGGDASTKYFCAAGRSRISGGTQVTPHPHENCNPIPDPLRDWDAPDADRSPITLVANRVGDVASRNKMALLGQLDLVLNNRALRPVIQNIRRAVQSGEKISDADAAIMTAAIAALSPLDILRARLDLSGTFTRGPADGLTVIEVAQVLGIIDNAAPWTYARDQYVDRPSLKLQPGTYGGLDIGHGHVEMAPGIYHIVDAPLVVRRRATLTGHGVTIIFHGDEATFSVLDEARLTLTGPETGPTAGFILAEHRDDTPGSITVRSRLTGSGAIDAIGTIYMPKHTLSITGDGAADQTSPLLQIVADSVELSDNGALDIVFAPGETDVPVAIMPKREARLLR